MIYSFVRTDSLAHSMMMDNTSNTDFMELELLATSLDSLRSCLGAISESDTPVIWKLLIDFGLGLGL